MTLRQIADLFITAYLSPLRLSSRLALYVKGKILTYDEHYLVALDLIRRKFPLNAGLVVDIGAFDADSTVLFAQQLPNNRIMGFEPNPVPYNKGLKNSEPYRNIEMYNLGFSDSIGEVDFQLNQNPVSSSIFTVKDRSEISPDKTIKVNVTTLDEFFKGYGEILLMKLDVQGAEANILSKASETLKKTRLVLTEVSIAEMYSGGCLYYEVDEILRRNGFGIHNLISNYNNEGVKYFDILYINLG